MNQTNLKCAINIFSVFLLLKVNKHKEKNEYWNQSTNHLKYNWSTRVFTNTLQIELLGSWCIRLLVIVVPKISVLLTIVWWDWVGPHAYSSTVVLSWILFSFLVMVGISFLPSVANLQFEASFLTLGRWVSFLCDIWVLKVYPFLVSYNSVNFCFESFNIWYSLNYLLSNQNIN